MSISETEQLSRNDSAMLTSTAVDAPSAPSYDATFPAIQPPPYVVSNPHQPQTIDLTAQAPSGYPHQLPYTQQTVQPPLQPQYTIASSYQPQASTVNPTATGYTQQPPYTDPILPLPTNLRLPHMSPPATFTSLHTLNKWCSLFYCPRMHLQQSMLNGHV